MRGEQLGVRVRETLTMIEITLTQDGPSPTTRYIISYAIIPQSQRGKPTAGGTYVTDQDDEYCNDDSLDLGSPGEQPRGLVWAVYDLISPRS